MDDKKDLMAVIAEADAFQERLENFMNSEAGQKLETYAPQLIKSIEKAEKQEDEGKTKYTITLSKGTDSEKLIDFLVSKGACYITGYTADNTSTDAYHITLNLSEKCEGAVENGTGGWSYDMVWPKGPDGLPWSPDSKTDIRWVQKESVEGWDWDWFSQAAVGASTSATGWNTSVTCASVGITGLSIGFTVASVLFVGRSAAARALDCSIDLWATEASGNKNEVVGNEADALVAQDQNEVVDDKNDAVESKM